MGVPIVVEDKERVNVGLKDCGHIPLECSNCNKMLADIWVTYTNKDFQWKVKAKCCYCGDESFEKEVVGVFVVGCHAVPHPDFPNDPDYQIMKTGIIDIKYDENTKKVTVLTEKK